MSNMLPKRNVSIRSQIRNIAVIIMFLFWSFLFLNSQSDREIVEWMSLKGDEARDKLLNNHEFILSLDTNVCQKRNIDVLIFVHTAVGNFLNRMKARDTWAGVTEVGNHSFATVFMIGETTNKSVQRLIKEESRVYKDIVQGNFIDSYKNLTYKHIMAYGWTLKNCPKVKMIMKADDDVVVNVFNMAAFFKTYGFSDNLLYGLMHYYSLPKRMSGNKWYVTYNEYPYLIYPKFCSGNAYLISPLLAGKIYNASSQVRFFWVDDTFVTGLLRLKVGGELTSLLADHDITNLTKPTANSMVVDAKHVWYSQWDDILKFKPWNLKLKTKSRLPNIE